MENVEEHLFGFIRYISDSDHFREQLQLSTHKAE